ncbi:hypothetical protein PpBr36_08749 [Pyricularia pennisetigena]|uniref:hypothetical protein n=1 Tax=Pyricularia pennisetigena TaxID=1578925 RepID=UPI001152E966|nr:hypothetical protein PpBr36_08749 [Pyricularia pennisetigena]TLS23935.1 hypothetical protein PpBr36_08749 [Pyricularia pennisetigena]
MPTPHQRPLLKIEIDVLSSPDLLDLALARHLGPYSSLHAGVCDPAKTASAEAIALAGPAARDQEPARRAGLASLELLAVFGLGCRQGRDGGDQGEDESGGELHCGKIV